MRSHPQLRFGQHSFPLRAVQSRGSSYLCIGLVSLNTQLVRWCGSGKSRRGRLAALLAPFIRIDTALEAEEGDLHRGGWLMTWTQFSRELRYYSAISGRFVQGKENNCLTVGDGWLSYQNLKGGVRFRFVVNVVELPPPCCATPP
jgi:hypothetical protein